MSELNDAMAKAAEQAFDRIWMGAAYKGMAQDAIRAALTAALALLPEAEQGWHLIETFAIETHQEADRLRDAISRALVGTGCTSPDGTMVHASTDTVVATALHTICGHRPLPAPPPTEGGQKG